MAPARPSRRLGVLVVEDNVTNRAVVSHVLKQRGHEVTAATTGVEAVTLAAERRFDVILMDVQMPGMDGYEATAAIRAQSGGPNQLTPIVAVTAHAMSGDRERCLAAGMNAFVAKPVRPEALLAAIDGLFAGAGPASMRHPARRRTPRCARPSATIDVPSLLEAFGHDHALLDETLGVFLADAPPADRGDCGRRWPAAEPVAMARAAHALKGAVSLFSQGAAYTAARALETAARAGVPDRLPTRLAAIERAVSRLTAGLEAIRPSLRPS